MTLAEQRELVAAVVMPILLDWRERAWRTPASPSGRKPAPVAAARRRARHRRRIVRRALARVLAGSDDDPDPSPRTQQWRPKAPLSRIADQPLTAKKGKVCRAV